MRHELRILGILPNLKGAGFMEQMLYRTISYENLTDEEIKEVLYAWETRNYIPYKLLKMGNCDRVSPAITREEVESGIYTQEEYDRAYVKAINDYLLKIWA